MNICVLTEIIDNKEQKIESYLFNLSENINGKYSWNSSEGYKIFWYTGETNQWILSGIPNTFIFSYTTNEIPTSGWQILGSRPPKQILNIRATTGNCENEIFVDYNVNIKNSSCKCNGEIIINTFSGAKPFEYFINNKKQNGNIIQNLCEGNYIVKVTDSNDKSTIKNVTIPKTNSTEYFISLNYNKNTGEFTLNCYPELTGNIKLKFDLIYQNVLNYSPQQNSVIQTSNEQLLLNNKSVGEYNSYKENTQVVNLQRPCIGTNYKIVKIKEWNNIIIESGDIFNGFIYSTLSPNIDVKTLCYNSNQELTLNLKNLELINCNCCNTTKVVNNK
jgi:hypothetical protein